LDSRREHQRRQEGTAIPELQKGDKLTGDPMIRSDVLYMITTAAKIGPDDQAFHCDLDFHTQGVKREATTSGAGGRHEIP
jgi:hypothetical protein